MGNAVFCVAENEAGTECNTHRQTSQQRLLAKCPRRQTTLKPHLCDEAKAVWGTTPARAYGRGGRSPELQQQQQNDLSSCTGISAVELSSVSTSISLIPDLGRASATPQLEWLQSSLPPSVSDPNLEPPHEYAVDFDTLSSDARPDRIAAASHVGGPTESSSHSSYFTPNMSGFEMPPDLGFAAHLERFASPELRASPSDSPTPVQRPLLAVSPVENPHWDGAMLPAAALPVTAVSPTVPVAPSPYSPFAQNASTGPKKPTGNWCSPDSESANPRRKAPKMQKEPMHESPTHPTQSQPHRRPFRQVTPMQAVHEVKPTDAVTFSAAHKGSKGHPQDTLPRRCLTDKGGTSALMLPPLDDAGALCVKAAANAAYTGNASVAGLHGSQPPLVPKDLLRYRENTLTGCGDAYGAKTANNREGAQSRESPRCALVARKMDEASATATLPSGASALPLPPNGGVSSRQGCTEQGFARLPLVKGASASSTALKPVQVNATQETAQSATNGGVRDNPASHQPPWHVTPDEDDAIPQLKFTAGGAAASSSLTRANWPTATAARTANQNHASTSSVPISNEAHPLSALRGTMKRGSLTLTEGGVRQDTAGTAHVHVSAQGANTPSRLHPANCMEVRTRETAQDSLLSALVPLSRSLRQVGAGEQCCSRSDDGNESPGEDKERSSDDGECLPRSQSVCDLPPNLGASHRVNSILKKTSSYRSLNGTPLERTLPAVGSVSFLLCEQEASLAMVSRQGVFKAVSHHAKPRQKEDHRLFEGS